MLYDEHGIFIGGMDEDFDNDILHYGTPRHSGRYPWGSGDNPYQRNASFLGKVDELKKAKGPDGKRLFSEKDIAASMGMNTSELRKRVSLANAENRAYLSAEAKKLKAKGMSTSAIARRMGRNESSVRLLLDEGVNERMGATAKNATILKDRVEKLNYIDVGKGSEQYLGISSTSLGNALHALEQEGYTLHDIQVEQMGTGKMTTIKVLAKPGVEKKDVYKHMPDIKMVKDVYSEDGGKTMRAKEHPVSVDPKRVMINYAETGGKDKDGVIELRRGVEDISLKNARYAQVRILVDGTHYLKGMAMYADDLPPGIDIRFNTNKSKDVPMINKADPDHSVLKPIKKDLENPFGANIKDDGELIRAQRHYIGKDGKEHLSALNIVSEEGTWYDWNRNLASQFLSKQTPALAKKQLEQAYDIAKSDFDEIKSYKNPVVKAQMLEDFANQCESDSVHLKAAALPRQSTRVILPLPKNKDNEIYAPGYRDGEEVALVRFPHASITEIPIMTVNNNNKHAKSVIGDALDAVGIPPAAAQRLSGADFDGDTVLVLPTKGVTIKSRPQYDSLKNVDLEALYPKYDGMHKMTSREKGLEMGKITNLITDMTFQKATSQELERALRHSMVVIDAEKHELDYKRSERENGILELKQKYQNGGGTSTLLSRSTSDVRDIPERKLKAPSKMSPEELARYKNGEQIWVDTGKVRTKRDYPLSRMTKEEKEMWRSGDKDKIYEVKKAMIADGRVKVTQKIVNSTPIEKGYLKSPYELVSTGNRETTTPMERIYADYAWSMKELAREARKEARNQPEWKVDPEMRKRYSREVESLEKQKLGRALSNAPLERQAQLISNAKMDMILDANPELYDDKEHLKRERGRQLDYARKITGAKKLTIGGSDKNPLTDKEWEAIENHAVSKTTLQKILANADKGRIRELATPRTQTGISSAKLARAKSMLANGYSRADVCDMLDISEGKLIYALGKENV